LPNWQKEAWNFTGLMKKRFNPNDKIEVITTRKVIKSDFELPVKEEYSNFIRKLLSQYD
jgi:hypothetical protein